MSEILRICGFIFYFYACKGKTIIWNNQIFYGRIALIFQNLLRFTTFFRIFAAEYGRESATGAVGAARGRSRETVWKAYRGE
jgi:hypothetical protein